MVVDHLKTQYGYKNLVLIGDGATDLEASPPADAFIGICFNFYSRISEFNIDNY